jgi:hypothetical protein
MLKLTNNHYVNPERIAHIELRPAGQPFSTAVFFAVFNNQEIEPINLSGADAEEAALNWIAHHAALTGDNS